MQVWNIPYPRNPFFTGREPLLAQLAETLKPGEAVALTPPPIQAISGLGGIGKTHLAVEYAYQHRQDYQVVLWTLADTRESLVSGYFKIARLLNLYEKDEQDQQLVVKAVQEWLKRQSRWLLILDNADDLALVSTFLPPTYGGHILLTTQAQATGTLARRLEVETMDTEAGALLLLRRASLVAPGASLEGVLPSDLALARAIAQKLGGLPLALDQAGAYIEETTCGLAGYQRLYQTRQTELLGRRGGLISDHPEPVATTWSLAFEKIEETRPAAAMLLRLCAFLHPDAIPEEIVTEGCLSLSDPLLRRIQGIFSQYGKTQRLLRCLATDAFAFNQAIGVLQKYSLLLRDSRAHRLTIHRLVQAILYDSMTAKAKNQWKQLAVRAVRASCPDVQDAAQWDVCEQWLPHALACATWIEQEQLHSETSASLLNHTGYYLIERTRYGEAEPLLRHALVIGEKVLGATHSVTARSLYNLARLYQRQGKYEEAELLQKRALAICEQKWGPMHQNTASSLNDLATLYCDQGKYGEAEPLMKRALAIDEQLLGNTHPVVARILNNLAALYSHQGKYGEAEPLQLRVLTICEQLLGVRHPDTASSLSNLALTHQLQGKYEEAESLSQRALKIREQQLGPQHLDTALSLNNLAELYRTQGKYVEAEPLYQRALSIHEQQLGPQHPHTATCLNNLALLYDNQGKYGEAEPLLKRALAIREQALGLEHPDTATSLNNLAELYRAQGKYTEAEPLYVRALALYEKQLGSQHPSTRTTQANYTLLLEAMKQDEATDL